MKYTDVSVGQRVLYNYKRTNNPKFRLVESRLAEVLQTGLPHIYSVTENDGWSSRTASRTTDQGVRIRYRNPEWDRFPFAHGDSDRPEYDETVTIAACLQPIEGESYIKWAALQADRLRAWQASQDQKEADKRLIMRFAEVGYEVSVERHGKTKELKILIDEQDVERLLVDLWEANAHDLEESR